MAFLENSLFLMDTDFQSHLYGFATWTKKIAEMHLDIFHVQTWGCQVHNNNNNNVESSLVLTSKNICKITSYLFVVLSSFFWGGRCFNFFYVSDGIKKSLSWHALKSKYFFFFQFGNNNNYMNMAEANNAFLAANEVDVFLLYLCSYSAVCFDNLTDFEWMKSEVPNSCVFYGAQNKDFNEK